MKIRAIGHWALFLGSLCLVWSGSSQPLCAGQNYPRQVKVFGHSPAASAASQGINAAKEADIRQLMELAGTKATVTRMMSTMEDSMRPLLLHSLPPGEYRERLVRLFFEKLRTKISPQHVLDLAVPIYAEYFSDAEIKGLIQFYKTPLGRKWVSVQPRLQGQLLPATREWSKKMGREAMREVLEEHPDLAEKLKAAEAGEHQH